jgi:CheY-like chemotaxis protein/signal transduction histidine kinase
MIQDDKNNMLSNIVSLGLKWKFLIMFILLILSSVSIVGYYGYDNAKEAYMKNALLSADEHAKTYSSHLSTHLEAVPADKHLILELNSVKRYLQWRNIGDDKEAQKQKIIVEKTIESFLKTKKNYHSICFVDKEGKETIKVIYDQQKDTAYISHTDELQNKSKSDYFKKGIKLLKDEMYVSEISLNEENGKITKPYLSVIRFTFPLIDAKGTRHGMLVGKLFAKSFLDVVDGNKNVTIINKKGVYLLHNEREKQLGGSDINRQSTFKQDKPELFKTMINKEDGRVITDTEVFHYKRFYLSKDKSNFVVVIDSDKKSVILSDTENFKYIFILILLLVLFFTFIIVIMFVNYLTNPLTVITNNLNIMAKGGIVHEESSYKWNDEIGGILKSLDQLINNSKRTINQAYIIAEGNYTERVDLLSKDDKLGIALNNMTESLQKNYEQNRHQNWIKDGVNALAKEISGDIKLQELSKIGLNFIASYLHVGKAALYIYDEEKSLLKLNAGYAFNKSDAASNSYEMGEGVVGQVALEKEPILLSDVPQNSEMKIQTGTTSAQPLNTYTMPLLHDTKLIGVIEFASHTAFNALEEQFIKEISLILATAINTSAQNEEVKHLLGLAKESQIKLEERGTELESANIHMQEQQAELEEANAQLEEQQQQLKISEIELKEKNQSLENSKEELDKKAKEIERSSEYKSEFLANMSHELRTPLNAIILLSSLLEKNKKKNLDVDDIKKVSTINRSGNELLRLISDILDLSKVESGKMEVVVDRFGSAVFLQEMKDLFEHTAAQKSIYFKILDEYQDNMQTDKNRLSQIIRNLLSNSFKFTKTGGITVKISKSNKPSTPIALSVSDTGVGIPQEKQQQIFEAFKQVDGTISREYGGTGLGLSISKELAHLLGGDIFLESKVNEGSVFTILLPNLVSKAEFVQDKPVEKVQKKIINDVQKEDISILVVEDDEDFAEVIRESIEDLGIKTIVAHNGKDALSLAKEYKPTGIVMDLGLPDMDGIDLMREMKSDISLRDIPIHILSGRDKEDKIMQSGVIGYSQKPVNEQDINDLIGRITNYVNKRVKDLLVVEDDEVQREAMIEWIGNDTIKSCGVGSAKEAITEIGKGIYDTVVVDLGLSEGSGYEVCDFIQNNYSQLPIIIYTGKELTKKESDKLRKYTDSIIIKTVNSQDRLVDEVDVFLHKARQTSPLKINSKEKDGDISLKDAKILIVDDDIKNIFVLDAAIGEYEGTTINASNGQEALDILADNSDIDIVLMDIMMPVMNGYEATKAIKTNEKLKDITVIAVTAKAMQEDKQKCIDAGADDFITKPIDIDILINMIRLWMDKR